MCYFDIQLNGLVYANIDLTPLGFKTFCNYIFNGYNINVLIFYSYEVAFIAPQYLQNSSIIFKK